MDDGITDDVTRRVLIADPQPIFRLGLATLLKSTYPGWNIAESDTMAEHRRELVSGSIDLLLINSHLLGLELVQGQPISSSLSLWVDIIAVVEHDDPIGALGCLGAGAHATIARSDPTSRTLATIDIIAMRHRQSASPRTPLPAAEPAEAAGILNLTPRQFDVLRLLAKGQSNKVIARDLGLSVSTVKVHLNTVFRALGARNRVEAVIRARPFQARMAPH